MGAKQSKKTGIINIEENDDNFTMLDLIATQYIVRGTFEDMKNLVKKEYCDKLVIVTTDVISHYFKEKNIRYLTRNIDSLGHTDDVYKNENVMWIKRPKVVTENNHDKYKDDVYNMRLDYRDREKQESKKDTSKQPLSELDIKDGVKKSNMCKGIAKFYITIGHIWAAILLSVNPRYSYFDPGTNETKTIDLEGKIKLPKGTQFERITTSDSLCDKRLKALGENPQNSNDRINLQKVCDLNRDEDSLIKEIGIPELENLYNDDYDYMTGTFSGRITGGKADQLYKKDLEQFYLTFTNNKDYKKWNSSGKRKFEDVILFKFKEECGEDQKGIFRKSFERNRYSDKLFQKYGEHIKNTKNTITKDRQHILSILHTIFVRRVLEDGTELITIDPKLTEQKLDDIVIMTRERIVNLYLTCEKNFKLALGIVKNISRLNVYKNTVVERVEEDIINELIESKPTPPDPQVEDGITPPEKQLEPGQGYTQEQERRRSDMHRYRQRQWDLDTDPTRARYRPYDPW
jgi:hypothetical protein